MSHAEIADINNVIHYESGLLARVDLRLRIEDEGPKVF